VLATLIDSDMPKVLFLGLVVIALVVLGCACLFRTTVLVEWARTRYQRSSRIVQAWPFSNLVLKPWYPTYLRGMGVYALLIAILVVYDIFRLLQQH
jgi:hypothetical protein